MSFEEIRQTVRVDKDHRVILSLPTLAEGTELQVTLRPVSTPVKRQPGSAIGLVTIEPGFDDPLEEFEDYR